MLYLFFLYDFILFFLFYAETWVLLAGGSSVKYLTMKEL